MTIAVSATALAQAPWGFVWEGQVPPASCLPFAPQTSNPSLGDLGAGWDILVHQEAPEFFEPNYNAGPAAHGPDCFNADPPPMHTVSTYEDTTFICNNHLMTFANGSYAENILTPDHMLDFSADEGAWMLFNLSTWRESDRDWWDLTLTPFEDNYVAHAVQVASTDGADCSTCYGVDLTGFPANFVHLELVGNNSVHLDVAGSDQAPPYCLRRDNGRAWGIHHMTPPSAVRRSPFLLQINRYWVVFSMYYQNPNPQPPYAPGSCDPGTTDWCQFVFQEHYFNPPLPWTRAVVQFGHHSYNPAKANGGYGPVCGPGEPEGLCGHPGQSPCCKPNTWHWGGVSMSNVVPFTIIQGSQRYVNANTSDTVEFDQPAPANAFLRFLAFSDISRPIQYSLDGGDSWIDAAKKPLAPTCRGGDTYGHLENYWTPIPAGTQSIKLRGLRALHYSTPWVVRDISIWAQNDAEVAPQNQ